MDYKEKVEEVFRKEIEGIAEALKLKVMPSLSFTEESSDAIMYVEHRTFVHSGYLTKRIVHTETDGVIHVSLKALQEQCLSYKLMCGTLEADYDVILIFLCHECRHIWQAENQWHVGRIYDPQGRNVQANVFGHGALEEEKDANDWMLSYMSGKRKLLADYIVASQNATGVIVDVEVLQSKALKTAYAYNPEWVKRILGGEADV